MTSDHIKQLLADGEGLTIEYKECVNGLNNSVWETVCSFSNRYGGHLILGAEDDGTPIGVNPNVAQQMKRNFANTLNNPQKTSPSLFLSLTEVDVDGRPLLHVYIPVSSQIQSCSGRIYDRNEDGDFDITNSADLVAQLSLRKSNQFTEREIFPYATLEDMRLDLVPRVKKMAVGRVSDHPWKDMDAMELFKSAGLYEEDKRTGKKGFNLAAILLFGKDDVVRSCAPGIVTDALLRRDNIERYDDRRYVETNLIEAYDQLVEFIAKHTNDPFVLIGDQNVSVRSWIARELVSNLLAHREYSKSYNAKLIIERERIYAENWNRSHEHGRIDPENFTPNSKNPLIAKFFMNIGRADQLGSGIRNLYTYTKLYSGGEPELIEGDIFKTIIPLVLTSGKQANNKRIKQANKTSENKRIIVDYIKEHDNASVADFVEILHLSDGRVRAILLDMTKEGLIEKIGKTKSAYYILK
ncbi:MAG: putative DNA binding domain-containing protein [Oscillospiraceae bacterium]|jgi:ATP-dependent DNA helicase RecG|nr:putative DNA binding domain-containing protein [Oscillospiraceae bacterium]